MLTALYYTPVWSIDFKEFTELNPDGTAEFGVAYPRPAPHHRPETMVRTFVRRRGATGATRFCIQIHHIDPLRNRPSQPPEGCSRVETEMMMLLKDFQRRKPF